MSDETTLPHIMRDTKASIGFLSRLPVNGDIDAKRTFTHTAHTFAFAGFWIGLLPAVTAFAALTLGLPPLVAAILAIGAVIAATGALHEDGLADCADGFWGASYVSKRLEIMRDSRIGTYGTIALVLSIALRVASLAALMENLGPLHVCLVIVAIGALSRAAMVWPWVTLSPARLEEGGLSSTLGLPDAVTLRWTLLCGLPAAVLLFFAIGLFASLVALAFTAAAIAGAISLARNKIGGHTGDVLGAVQQVCEITLLVAITALV